MPKSPSKAEAKKAKADAEVKKRSEKKAAMNDVNAQADGDKREKTDESSRPDAKQTVTGKGTAKPAPQGETEGEEEADKMKKICLFYGE